MFRKTIGNGKLCGQLFLPACILLAYFTPLPCTASNSAPEQVDSTSDSASALSSALKLVTRLELGLKIDDVNDLGYALQRIRQQAINIYIEATRKQHSAEVGAELPSLHKVPAELPKDMSGLLPFRRPWLVYFVTTLEPLVHLLKEDIKEVETGARTLNMEPETRQVIEPLFKEWSQGVGKLDQDLTDAVELIEDADKSNVELAKIAYDLDSEVSKLEQVRDRCFRIVDEMERKSNKSAK